MPVYLNRCSVCLSPLREQINRRFAQGVSASAVSRWLADEGAYISPLTLRKHRQQHLTDEVERGRQEQARELQRQSKTLKPVKTTDLATLVRDNVSTRLEGGELSPTVSEGLRAQELLDRRLEKGADRGLALRIAGLMSRLPGLVEPYVEGEYREDTLLVEAGVVAGSGAAGD